MAESITFPEEIHQEIIDYFRWDPKFLNVLCLVSRSWLIRARHLFFARYQVLLKVCPNIPESAPQKGCLGRFRDLLRNCSSTLPAFIQDVYVVGPEEFFHCIDEHPKIDEAYNAFCELLKDLSRLQNLRKLVFQGLVWRRVKPEARIAVRNLPTTFLTFSTVAFEDHAEFVGLLELCSGNIRPLEGLRIHFPRFARESHVEEQRLLVLSNGFPHLLHLDLELYNSVFPLLCLSAPQSRKIETLVFNYASMRNAALIGTFIQGTGSSLRHLVIDITHAACAVTSGKGFPISLVQSTNLQSLVISTMWLSKYATYDTRLLLALISTINSGSFETLTLWFCLEEFDSLQSFNFEAVERCLIEKAPQSRPPILQLNFLRDMGWEQVLKPDCRAWFAAALETRLPSLHKLGHLVLNFREPIQGRPYGDWENWSPKNREWFPGCVEDSRIF